MKITLWIDDTSGQIVQSSTEPWSNSGDDRASTVPSPPSLVLNDEQKRLFTKAKQNQTQKAPSPSPHPVWSKLDRSRLGS